MDSRDWTTFLLPFEQAVEELKIKIRGLRTELTRREAYSPIEFVTGRVKRISSILVKADLLKIPLDELDSTMEDIGGIRIMCQFVEDIQRVADMLRKRTDMEVCYEKDYIAYTKPSGYRSYHLIVRYPVQTALGLKHVLVEIQIRTLAMNFWATIEHSLHYKYKDTLPEHVQLRLKQAAEAAYKLDQEMSSIREEIQDAQVLFEDSSNLVSFILRRIQELYFFRRVREAAQFQLRFNESWSIEDMVSLRQLAKDLEKAVASAQQGGEESE